MLNKATAIEICAYLVICKYTDRYGYDSGVGYKTLKERLGVGQRKISEAIRRLKSMEFAGQKLLYSRGDWLYQKTGSFPIAKDNFGWIRGWIESEYSNDVWLSNNLVGKNADKERPLNFFIKTSGRDNHARLLLLLYKYHNRQYSGVNYRFASITSEIESYYKIAEFEFYKSRLGSYHISQNIINKIGINITHNESCNILKDLQKNNFVNVSISVLGTHPGSLIPDKIVRVKKRHRRDTKQNDKQIVAWNRNNRVTFTLAKLPDKKDSKAFVIGVKKIRKETELKEFKVSSFEYLTAPPEDYLKPASQFVYRLDYKSNNKRNLEMEDCLANCIEGIVQKFGLEGASRNGKFYDKYWWLDPGIPVTHLVGIIMPSHIQRTQFSALDETIEALNRLALVSINDVEVVNGKDIVREIEF